MAITTIVGFVIGVLLIVIAITGGTDFGLILPFINMPSILIVVGCSFGALMINHTFQDIFSGLKALKYTLNRRPPSPDDVIDMLVKMAVKARKEGFMGLRDQGSEGKHPLLDLGVSLMADGTDPQLVREILETKSSSQAEAIASDERIWRDLSVYCPMFGMIGTLIGLVQMLRGLSDPSTIGPAMAVALITTFYGIVIAGLVCIPIAGKINFYSQMLALSRELIMTGVLSIQSGNNSRVVEEKLKALLPK